MPILAVIECMPHRDVHMTPEEDDESAIAAVKTGFSHTMKHLAQWHCVSLLLHNIYIREPNINVCHIKVCPTKKQVADVFTKALDTGIHRMVVSVGSNLASRLGQTTLKRPTR